MLRLLEMYKCILFVHVTLKYILDVRTVFHAKFIRGTNILAFLNVSLTLMALIPLLIQQLNSKMLY